MSDLKVFEFDSGGKDWVVARDADHAREVLAAHYGGYDVIEDANIRECPPDSNLHIEFEDAQAVAYLGITFPPDASVLTLDDDTIIATATFSSWADFNKPCFLCSTEY